MANICENKMYVESTDVSNIEYIIPYVKEELQASIEVIDDFAFECYFDSKWDFPIKIMEEFVKGIPNKDDIYIRVLSVEEGNYYCAFHVYEGEEWEYK
jgi:hypothetical protein